MNLSDDISKIKEEYQKFKNCPNGKCPQMAKYQNFKNCPNGKFPRMAK